ncbi:MAG: hypothetical protein V1846_02375 [Candidatus Komeilibacteria bacterium]
MEERQQKLLQSVIEHYIATAQPVGSVFLAQQDQFDLSPATIRNELLDLEARGLIYQPHTSAGRVPTIKGLRYYLESLMTVEKLDPEYQEALRDYVAQWGARGLAKIAAELSSTAVVIASDVTNFYYTGFSRLFLQPEFTDVELVRSLTQAVDRLDVILPKLFGQLERKPLILLGRHNPFGAFCSALFISNAREPETIMGLLGPIRTDYARNVALLREAVNYL